MKRILLLILPLFVLTSCLNETLKDQVDFDDIYTDATSIYTNAVASLYNYTGSQNESEGLQGTCRGVWDYNTLTTDEAMIPIRGGDWYDGGYWENLYLHRWTANDTYLYDVWKYLYKVIVLSNESLNAIERHRDLLTEAQYRSYTAEVRAIRAMYHYYAMDFFGSVPMVDGTGGLDQTAQSKRSEMFRFVVSELQDALPDLPVGHSNLMGNCYGRVTESVAHFLLAKLALNAEIYNHDDWTDGHQPSGKDITIEVDGLEMNAWQACIYYCDMLAADGYTLSPDYTSNFAVHNENSPENIFVIPLDKQLYASQYHYLFRSRHYKHGGAYHGSSENGTCATLSTVRANGYGTDSEDMRFRLNFYADTVWVDGAMVMLDDGTPLVYRPLELQLNLTASPYKQTAGARQAKYEVDRTAYSDGRQPDNDIVLFRYADALLMKAEAKVRNGEDGAAELNAVRERVGMLPREATLENILEERLLELVWEGWRRQDLVRFGLYHKAYDLRTPLQSEADAHTTVFPIPQKCIELNKRLKQNPGY